MSWLPLYNSWLICFFLVSLFFWKLGVVGPLVAVLLFSIVFLVFESASWSSHYSFGFWLFIGSEIIIFLTLFLLVLYNEVGEMGAISSLVELPLLGSFLLIGSSITATCYHHCLGLSYNWLNLLLTIFLGLSFVALQMLEFYDCDCGLLNDSFYCSCFCTVGLHFLHVVIGIFLLMAVLFLYPLGLGVFYIDLSVWYWHFVDYIWLVVFFIVYCSCL